MFLLDAQVDGERLDVGEDSAPDVAEDASADVAQLDAAGICIEQIIANGYAFTPAAPCSACQDTQAQSLDTQCQQMIGCLQTNNCTSQSGANNC